jgi:hypothetical protein
MPSSQFDLLGLPAELRTLIYEYYFTSDSVTSLRLAICPTPDTDLLATSKFIHNEASLIYDKARQEYQSQRAQVWQSLTDELDLKLGSHLLAAMVGLAPRGHRLCRLRTAASVAKDFNIGRAIICSDPQSHRHGQIPGGCDCDLPAPLVLHCQTCPYLLRSAVYFSVFSEQYPRLLSEYFHGGLNDVGADMQAQSQALHFDSTADFHCARNFGIDFWRLELDKPEFIDLRCNIRFDAVMDYYYRSECWFCPFSERNIRSVEEEMMEAELKCFEDFRTSTCMGS